MSVTARRRALELVATFSCSLEELGEEELETEERDALETVQEKAEDLTAALVVLLEALERRRAPELDRRADN